MYARGFQYTVSGLHARLWDGLDDPYLYTVTARLDNGETETARFGCRKFEIDPQKGFILNGHPYPLRGVSRHQDRKGAGVAITKEMMEEDMALILEMGANTIRLAHYQHAQAFYDLCDEKGLVIWAEIPYITMHMHNGRANTLTQMEELIVQNYNHPCIAVWGLSNEITAASPVNEELLENHRALNDLAHKLDPTRPTTMANIETRLQISCYTVETSLDGETWTLREDVARECSSGYYEYAGGIRARYIRVTGGALPYGQTLRVSGLRVFGNGEGDRPAQADVKAVRVDALDGKISWQHIENAQGCNVRYGIAPDKLYQSWLVYDADEVTLSTLMAGQTYYVCVDSFNENGITTGKIIKMEG